MFKNSGFYPEFWTQIKKTLLYIDFVVSQKLKELDMHTKQ